MRSLKLGEINYFDLTGTLFKNRSLHFKTVIPQGHYGHGKAERKIGLLQESLEKSELRFTRCTFSGWTCVAKLIKRTVNSIPSKELLLNTDQLDLEGLRRKK